MEKKNKTKGMRAIVAFLPHIIFILFLYSFMIVATIFLNKYNYSMAQKNQETSECIVIVNDLQAQSSKLSSISISFTHQPTIDDTNILKEDILKAYFNELGDIQKNPKMVLERMKIHSISEAANNYLNNSAESAKKLLTIQSHSFHLINSVSYIEIPEKYFMMLEKYDLTADELAYTDEEKLDAAFNLVLSQDYSSLQNSISINSRLCANEITSAANAFQNEYSQKLSFARTSLWISIMLVVISSIIFFIMLFRRLIFPISNFAKQINDNQKLDTKKGLYEANYLAESYNNLLIRHEEYNQMLKDVAEIDALTKLPNRYSLNEYLSREITDNKSSCVFVLDINNLKYVNDTFGHTKGDELIKNASICIRDAFQTKEGKNCFRIGGDEFIVILDNISQLDIDKHLKIFLDKEQELNVSIAYGYSYTSNVKEYGYEKLIQEADKKMYKNKNEMYKHNDVAYIN